MHLHRASREFIRWPDAKLPEGTDTIELRFDHGDTEGTWLEAEVVDGVPRVLVAGPDADPGTTTVVLAPGRTFVRGRLVDNPEAPVRDAGVVDVK